MAMKIDYDRGIHKRSVDALGLDVYMYVDTPGVYLNAHGTEVSEDIARKAGFPVDDHLKQRKLKERLAAARKKILEEADAVQEKKVVKERRGFKIVDIGLDRYQVISPDDDVLTKQPQSKREAEIVFDQVVPENEGKAK